MKRAVHGIKVGAIAFLTLFLLLYASFKVGPQVESNLGPVVTNAKVAVIDTKEDSIVVGVSADTVRSCLLMHITAMVTVNGATISGVVKFKDPSTGELTDKLISRPVGSSFSVLHIFPAGDVVSVSTFHRCHPFWESQTRFFTIDTSKLPNQVE